MKKLYTLLTVLALLVASRNCSATTLNISRPELACDHGYMHYTIPYGDTLSGIARHYRQSMTVIASVRANHIVNANRIYAGNDMMIPCGAHQTMAVHAVTVRKTVRTAAHSTHHARRNHGTSVPMITAAHGTVELATSPDSQTLVALQETEASPVAVTSFVDPPPTATPVAVVVASTSQEPAQPPLRSRSSTIKKAKRVKGYKLVLTSQEAKDDGITLNRDLRTRILYFKSKDDEDKGIMAREKRGLRSRAKREGNNIVLYLPLKAAPSQPFVVLISGTNQLIDSDFLITNAQPFYGRFPGPNRFERTLMTSGRALGMTALITFSSGGNLPLGIALGCALPVIRNSLAHKANAMQENAEDPLILARLNLASIPNEITSTNPPH